MSRRLVNFLRAPGCTALLCAFAALPARGQEAAVEPGAVATPAAPREPLPLWEVGAVAIGAYLPAYPGADQELARARILPFGIYRGSMLHVDDSGVGLRAYRTPRVEWDLSASAAFGASANSVRARAGMPAIGYLGEIGPAFKINLGDLLDARRDARSTRLEVPLRAVFEARGGISHQGWTFEPRLTHVAWSGSTAALALSASALVGDRKLNHLYYGVDAPYATSTRPAYAASAGLVALRLGASLRHRIDATLRMVYFVQLETVRGAANEASPLVRSKQDGGAGVSLIWGAWHSAQGGAE